MKGNWLEFSDFLLRAKAKHLPATRIFWRKQEKEGRVAFRKLPSGRRVFKDEIEVDQILEKYENAQTS